MYCARLIVTLASPKLLPLGKTQINVLSPNFVATQQIISK